MDFKIAVNTKHRIYWKILPGNKLLEDEGCIESRMTSFSKARLSMFFQSGAILLKRVASKTKGLSSFWHVYLGRKALKMNLGMYKGKKEKCFFKPAAQEAIRETERG